MEEQKFCVYDTDSFAITRDAQGSSIISMDQDSTRITLSKTIGRGAFSKVKLGSRTFSDESGTHTSLYAVKKMHKPSLEKNRCSIYDDEGLPSISNNLEKVRMEVSIWRQLCHPNVVRLYEILNSPDEDYMFLVIEYADIGQIMHWDTREQRYLHTPQIISAVGKELGVEACAKSLFRQVAQALKYLHGMPEPIIHRDVKPDNILYSSSDGNVKLTDFTVARRLPNASALCWDSAGTTAFLAPESMISGNPYSGQMFDCWALGVCIYVFMGDGKLPFWDPEHELHMQLMIQNDEAKYPETWSPPLRNVVEGLLKKNPEERMTLDGLLQSQWLNQ